MSWVVTLRIKVPWAPSDNVADEVLSLLNDVSDEYGCNWETTIDDVEEVA